MLIDVIVEGITGLMQDTFTNDLLDKGPKSTASGQEPTPHEQAERRLCVDNQGHPCLPADNLLSCIIDAGCFIKVGRRQLSTRDTTTVTSFLSIVETFLLIQSEKGWRVDARGIVNQVTKGRHICYRPIFDEWKLAFTLDIDTTEASLKTVRELIDRAGRSIGIGVMRPSRKGRYGQFKVIKWSPHKEDTVKVVAA